jgi:hypothetical protein
MISCEFARANLTCVILLLDFLQVMKFLEYHDRKDNYPFDRQCLAIFDCVLPATSNISSSTQSKLLEHVLISDRSLVFWQLYVAKDLGQKDHFGCLTLNVIHLIKSLRMIRPNLSFTFIPECCPNYESTMFRICPFIPMPNDELATYMSLLWVRLKQSLVSHLDPAGKVIGEHLPISVSKCPDNSTLRFSKGLLGRNKCKGS